MRQLKKVSGFAVYVVMGILIVSLIQLYSGNKIEYHLTHDSSHIIQEKHDGEEGKGYQTSVNIISLDETYIPAQIEQYILDNMVNLGYSKTDVNPSGCDIWTNPNATTNEIYGLLTSYGRELDRYSETIQNFQPVPDLIQTMKKDFSLQGANNSLCRKLRLHSNGLKGLFPSRQLSYSKSGYIDPLLPPMRDRNICMQQKKDLMTINYLVHDFEHMCYKLKPTSQIILIDMGASLDFHGAYQPIIALMSLYEKFGFMFDHIYAFEITPKDPNHVYQQIPEKYLKSYHWFNVGVDSTEGHKMNPLHSILKQFDEDDLIVVKLDIDTSSVEVPLARQLLEDPEGIYSRLVDQFYFEHHVHLNELARPWGRTMSGSIKDSLELFHGLRRKGIPAHFWP